MLLRLAHHTDAPDQAMQPEHAPVDPQICRQPCPSPISIALPATAAEYTAGATGWAVMGLSPHLPGSDDEADCEAEGALALQMCSSPSSSDCGSLDLTGLLDITHLDCSHAR